ncbi:LysR family transcriptional regulator, glycine cleavage system transcriptional activator [Cohaesibacter sp. ES.047]|uniref:LysR substrate-binding domain-containing protein n=1 Tax=Cohaesibacter sp. ES.047 TaxID=1798205 RepID=UPI000BB8E1C9|nr:LysR substrate-binding domain-containing protein [Cohaesibacter sp. ES.047]SNY91053.1 LysR family transcriptional regulator, glycine cleavage system transcriptional activator [Cohaesibacter sp. ES.047]
MQKSQAISLNAVRVFAIVAEHHSFKRAAESLGVTPGAVSRHVQALEEAMGVSLFFRRNNSICLTEIGEAFLQQAVPSLRSLNQAIETAMGEGQSLTVSTPTTLAMRWLIPQLKAFRQLRPDIAVRIETKSPMASLHPQHVDFSINYVVKGTSVGDAEILFEDRSRPYMSPDLASSSSKLTKLSAIPALQSTSSNWDWKTWLAEAGFSEASIQYGGYFDLDDAALRAAIAGMGMALSPEFIIADDLEAGRLCALPESPSVLLGHYTMTVMEPKTSAAMIFAKWLRSLR